MSVRIRQEIQEVPRGDGIKPNSLTPKSPGKGFTTDDTEKAFFWFLLFGKSVSSVLTLFLCPSVVKLFSDAATLRRGGDCV